MSVPPSIPFHLKFGMAISCYVVHVASNLKTEEFNQQAMSSERDLSKSLPYLIAFVRLISQNGELLKQQLENDPESLDQVTFDLKLIKTKLKHPKIEQSVLTLITQHNVRTILRNLQETPEVTNPSPILRSVRVIAYSHQG